MAEEDVRWTIGEGRTCRSRIEVSIDSIRRFFRFKKQYRFHGFHIYSYSDQNGYFFPKMKHFYVMSKMTVKYEQSFRSSKASSKNDHSKMAVSDRNFRSQTFICWPRTPETVEFVMKTFLPLAISITIIMNLIHFWNLLFCFFIGESILGTGLGWIIRRFTTRKVKNF